MARPTPDQPGPAGVRYVGPYGEQTAFVLDDRGLGRRRSFAPGVPVELAPAEVEQMLTHPDYEPVTAADLTAGLAAEAAPAPTTDETPES